MPSKKSSPSFRGTVARATLEAGLAVAQVIGFLVTLWFIWFCAWVAG